MQLFTETFGSPANPALLMIMGNSAPGLVWPDALCGLLAADLFVIRFDARDTGRSPAVDFEAAPYDLHDLVRDALGVLDAHGVARAHVVGMSQGGTLAYMLALAAPERVLTVTALMSSPDLRPKNDAFAGAPPRDGELPRPAAAYVAAVIALNATDDGDPATRFVENFRLAAGPASPFDEAAWRALGEAVAGVQAGAKVANRSNHARAQARTPALSAADLARIAQPVLVLHGGGDPIFPPAHAEWAAACLPDARLEIVPTMGHALDPAFFDRIAGAIRGFVRPAAT